MGRLPYRLGVGDGRSRTPSPPRQGEHQVGGRAAVFMLERYQGLAKPRRAGYEEPARQRPVIATRSRRSHRRLSPRCGEPREVKDGCIVVAPPKRGGAPPVADPGGCPSAVRRAGRGRGCVWERLGRTVLYQLPSAAATKAVSSEPR
jgi:hypothetical protein